MLTYSLATAADDADLRRLLRENAFPGALSLTFEREPSFFSAAALEGPWHQTLIARTPAGELVGMGHRAVRPMYLNGQVQAIGYLSQLRLSPRYQWGLTLARTVAKGFAQYQALHADGRAPFYLLSVIEDNTPARRLLTAQLPGMPHLRPYAALHTYTIAPRHPKPALPPPRGLTLTRATPAHLPALLACLQRNHARYQFAPYWSEQSLFTNDHSPDLHFENFFLVLKSDQVVGCLALWDQTRFKQTVVQRYGGVYARWRGLINIAAWALGLPHLPPPGTALHHAYASHLAVDEDDPVVFGVLLRAVYHQAQAQGLAYFMLGLSAAHPLRPVLIRHYRHLTYTAQLYLVAWPDGLPALAQVDARVPAPEIAVM